MIQHRTLIPFIIIAALGATIIGYSSFSPSPPAPTAQQAGPENIQEHSLQVAMIAHGLAIIRNRVFGGRLDPQRTAVLALYHDVGEVITGDLPTPIKNFNPKIKLAYNVV